MLNLGPKLCSNIKKYSFVVAAIANWMSHCHKQAGPFLTLNYEAGIPKCLAHTHSSTHHVRPFSFSVKAFLANRIVCVVIGGGMEKLCEDIFGICVFEQLHCSNFARLFLAVHNTFLENTVKTLGKQLGSLFPCLVFKFFHLNCSIGPRFVCDGGILWQMEVGQRGLRGGAGVLRGGSGLE